MCIDYMNFSKQTAKKKKAYRQFYDANEQELFY